MFVLSCLHKDGIPVAVSVVESIQLDADAKHTLRSIFRDIDDATFKSIVDEFAYLVSRIDLEKWYTLLDEACYISKKREETKND